MSEALVRLLEGSPTALAGPLAQISAVAEGSSTAAPAAPAEAREANFQPYIFWAFALACLLIGAFTLWTAAETRRVARRIDSLEERLRRGAPPTLPPEAR